ncbi:nicotinamide riboside transporter PnuC [Flagellimonas hadalis]|uniref:Nicotinamide riboside transporter PnuC n=1 Tax=Flagellimonas hadalis TaxID=2597517 RepID=A0A5N5IZH2_9FLAO|nr:nicotinamide mononucleotide transporter [Allomuricauda hadalis]
MEPYIEISFLQFPVLPFLIFQVLLARKVSIYNYLFGIGSILILVWELWQSRLYGEVGINLIFLGVNIYGWSSWLIRKRQPTSLILYSTCFEHRASNLVVLCCLFGFSYLLRHFTNSGMPYWCAMIYSFSFTGMWLMAKGKIESWIYITIGNCIAITLFVYRELYICAGQTIVLCVIGILGYLKWQRKSSIVKDMGFDV